MSRADETPPTRGPKRRVRKGDKGFDGRTREFERGVYAINNRLDGHAAVEPLAHQYEFEYAAACCS